MPALIETPYPVLGSPASEPLLLADAKRHLNVADSITAHDTYITSLIEQARQQFEHDTQWLLITRTACTLTLERFTELQFTKRPITSITSITYYDTDDSQQTLATSVYDLDTTRHQLRLKYNQVWPEIYSRWDAITITFVAGEHTDESTVQEVAKHALRLLVGYYWLKNRGDFDGPYDLQAYLWIVARFMQGRYP